VPAGELRREVVAILGSATVDGDASGDVVSILGGSTVNGSVGGQVVSILGTTTVRGKVSGELVSVLGDVVLGPDAEVENVVVVMGKLRRDEGAIVHGTVQQVGGGSLPRFDGLGEGLKAWIEKCLLLGRPLGIGENLGWAWLVAGGFVVFYMLLALIFPRGVVRSAEALEQHPGGTLLAAVLAAFLVPVALVLLVVTGVGVLLVPFLGAGLKIMALFGMTSVLAWFGRRVLGTDKSGLAGHPAVAVLVGGVIVSLLYTIWGLGFALWMFFGILGVGMVIYALMLASKRNRPVVAAASGVGMAGVAAAASAPGVSSTTAAAAAADPVAASESMRAAPTEEPPPVSDPFTPPLGFSAARAPQLAVISASTLPRVGFWLRLGASVIDAILVGIVCGFISSFWRNFGNAYLFWFAVYCVTMWATKGTTIGGIIFGLKVVRLDDRPVEWGVAVVRALGGFLSLFAAGLGFIWVSFDDERQSWHDKIAGTTIVRVPKGTPLL
jgi:uncharacterized RDD family membrane protein YckC